MKSINYSIRTFLVAFCFLCFIGCSDKENFGKSDILSGRWAFINNGNYYEIEFGKQNLTLYDEVSSDLDTFNYTIKKNSISFAERNFKISYTDCCNLQFLDNVDTIVLYPVLMTYCDSLHYNPYLLKKCFFLVNRGEITINEAVEYFKPLDWDVEEEIIPLSE